MIKTVKPSITYLELLALCIAAFTWSEKIRNQRVEIACDNVAAVNMVNNTTSGCKKLYVFNSKTGDPSTTIQLQNFCKIFAKFSK